ncbi:hypothetical protein Sjap_011369 [Stephania japonica]|uniref:Uncharacterized protein n=1 Tax=Stephania japonica TaxID=461633 RepID=A0AAP0P4N4_9MAGN
MTPLQKESFMQLELPHHPLTATSDSMTPLLKEKYIIFKILKKFTLFNEF